MSGGAPLAVVRAGWLRANDRMTLERAQAAFLAMYEAARISRDDGLKGAPSAASLRSQIEWALHPGRSRGEGPRAVRFAQAFQKARARVRGKIRR